MIYMYTINNKVFFSVRLFVLCFFKVIVLVDVVEFISRVHQTLKAAQTLFLSDFITSPVLTSTQIYLFSSPPIVFFTLMNFSLISSCMTYDGLWGDNDFSSELCISIFRLWSFRLFLSLETLS